MQNIIINTLSIELTRRCNLNCDFCARGPAQNMTITKEIIDKTLTEIKDYFIMDIRLNGGEPFLAPDMMEYLIDQLIEKEIAFTSLTIFTNGTIKDERIVRALNNAADYITSQQYSVFLKKCQDALLEAKEKKRNGTVVYIEFSTNGHPTTDETINDVRDWYIQRLNFDKVSCILQSRGNRLAITSKGRQVTIRTDHIVLEGNAFINYEKLIQRPVDLKKIRIYDNTRCLINDCVLLSDGEASINVFTINKSITISANGNVFPGCMMSYERVDKEAICNILDCNNDFYDKIDSFSWKHPYNEKAKQTMNLFQAFDFCKDHNLLMLGEIKKYEKTIDNVLRYNYYLKDWILKYEAIAKKLHKEYPFLLHHEIDDFAIFSMADYLISSGEPKNRIDSFIFATFGDHKDTNDIAEIKKVCNGVIAEAKDLNKERAKLHSGTV